MSIRSFTKHRFLTFNLVMLCLVTLYYIIILQPLISIDQTVRSITVSETKQSPILPQSSAYRTQDTATSLVSTATTSFITQIKQPRPVGTTATATTHGRKITQTTTITQYARKTQLNISHCRTSLKYTSNMPIITENEVESILETTEAELNKSTAILKMRHCLVEKTNLLVVIFSSIEHVEHRDYIRKTWSSLNYIRTEGHFSSQSYTITIVDHLFVVAISLNTNSNQRERLLSEISEENDILPIFLNQEQTDLIDLHLIASSHILSRCRGRLDYVLFQVDHLMPNLPLLLTFIVAQKQDGDQDKKAVIHCFPVEGLQPLRPDKRKHRLNKRFISLEEWPGKYYPTHCNIDSGGFLISEENLRLWLACSTICKPFRIANIFLTGILSHVAGLSVQPYWNTLGRFEAMLPSHSAADRASQCLFLTKTNRQPFGVWKTVFQAILREAI